jgi:hypothetical protein
VLGRVLIAGDRVRIEAGSGARYQALRAQFESQVGRLVEFTAERVDDLAGKLRQQQVAPYDAALVPPRLLEHGLRMHVTSSRVSPDEIPPGISRKEAAAHLMRQQLRSFLDDRIPVLGDRAPRAAAADPVWRPRLLTLMKYYVQQHDTRNPHEGHTDDINWFCANWA